MIICKTVQPTNNLEDHKLLSSNLMYVTRRSCLSWLVCRPTQVSFPELLSLLQLNVVLDFNCNLLAEFRLGPYRRTIGALHLIFVKLKLRFIKFLKSLVHLRTNVVGLRDI